MDNYAANGGSTAQIKMRNRAALKIILTALSIILLLGCAVFIYIYENFWQVKVNIFSSQNKRLDKGQIVFVGDSLTQRCNLKKYYGKALALEPINRGINGDTTDGLLRRMDASVFDLAPSKIVINIGTNDLAYGKNAGYVLENYTQILNLINTGLPDAEVYVQSVYPVGGDSKRARITGDIMAVNSALAVLAEGFGYTFIDVFPVLTDGNNLLIKAYTKDGLHLNAAGYKVAAQKILEYL